MEFDNLVHIELCQLVRAVCSLDGDKVRYLRQTVDNDPDGIIPSAGFGKSDNEIHTYVVPFPLRYLKGLEIPSGFLMLGLYQVAYIAACDIVGDILLHTGPPECLFQVLEHLGAPRVNRIS